jgi:hypothetical protein
MQLDVNAHEQSLGKFPMSQLESHALVDERDLDRAWLDTTDSDASARSCTGRSMSWTPGPSANGSSPGLGDWFQRSPNVTRRGRSVLEFLGNEVSSSGSNPRFHAGLLTKSFFGIEIGAKVSVSPSRTRRVHAYLPEDGLFNSDSESEHEVPSPQPRDARDHVHRPRRIRRLSTEKAGANTRDIEREHDPRAANPRPSTRCSVDLPIVLVRFQH